MYDLNICSPLYDSSQNGETNLRATRILLAVDLLLLCLAYNLISFVLKKNINDLKLEDRESNQRPIQQLEHAYKVPLVRVRSGTKSTCCRWATMWWP